MKVAIFPIFILCFYFHSYGQAYDSIFNEIEQDSAFIDGKIILSEEQPTFVQFFVSDYLLGVQRSEYATVDNEGRFQIKFFIRNTHEVYWRFGENGLSNVILVSPGDSLTIMMNDKEITFAGILIVYRIALN